MPFLIPMEMPSLLTLVVSHTGEDSVPISMRHFESHYTDAGHSNLYLSKGDTRLSSWHLQDLESREGFRPAIHALLDVIGCVSVTPWPSPVFLLLCT